MNFPPCTLTGSKNQGKAQLINHAKNAHDRNVSQIIQMPFKQPFRTVNWGERLYTSIQQDVRMSQSTPLVLLFNT